MVRLKGCEMMNLRKMLIFCLVFAFVLMDAVSAAQIWEVPYNIENDRDLDHLNNSKELERGTNPNNRDTEGDGLTDGNERKRESL